MGRAGHRRDCNVEHAHGTSCEHHETPTIPVPPPDCTHQRRVANALHRLASEVLSYKSESDPRLEEIELFLFTHHTCNRLFPVKE